ncbi:MAG: flotillin family protein [Deltaproteobacteria bacterium]|jgi:flotillin|nr:flotillin family protein [Deltaproteobacteria bacterium]MBW2530172.1 flotillin family protein [Deltaproteobacteria bacterium]
MTEIAIALVITALVVLGFIVYTLKNLVFVATPNQVLILAGSQHRQGDRILGYRAIRGGRAIRIPLIESVFWMDLSNIAVEIQVNGAFSKGGIPLNVHGIAHVKLPGEEPRLSNAVERFLGRSRGEIAQIARETLEGNVRGVLAQLTPEQVNQDKLAFANTLLEEAEHDMQRMGLVLDTLKIQNVTDDANYLNSIGRIRGAEIRRDASVVEAEARAEAAEQKAGNEQAAKIAKIKADLAIAIQETARRIRDAETKREAWIAEAEGKVLAEIAKIEEDINRQKARELQVKRQLDADVIQPWEAERQKMQQEARAAAARTAERGRAEAEALKRLVEEYKSAGAAAREVLVLQQLMPMVHSIAGADRKTRIDEWAVVPDRADGGASLVQKAITASEQIRAATGLDLTKVAGRVGGGSAPPPPPPPPPKHK